MSEKSRQSGMQERPLRSLGRAILEGLRSFSEGMVIFGLPPQLPERNFPKTVEEANMQDAAALNRINSIDEEA
jgi:hypothetical protein